MICIWWLTLRCWWGQTGNTERGEEQQGCKDEQGPVMDRTWEMRARCSCLIHSVFFPEYQIDMLVPC